MFPSSNADLQVVNSFQPELKLKIFRILPVKVLAISRLVSLIWRNFIDTYFPEVFCHQFLFILSKYPVDNKTVKDDLFRFAIKKTVAYDFEKALELEKNLEHPFIIEQMLDDLIDIADSKEKILKIFDLYIKREDPQSYTFFSTIKPLIDRYFSIHASLKKENQEIIVGNFNEACSVLKKFHIHQEAHLLIGLYLVQTYPEHAKNQQDTVFGLLHLEGNWFYYIETKRVDEKFSFSTLLKFLVIAKVEFQKKLPYLFERITSRQDALDFLSIGGGAVQKFIKHKKIYEHLKFFDLLAGASLLLDEMDTYDFYGVILKRAESVGEFEIGLQKLLEREPKENNIKKYYRLIVSIIIELSPTDLLSFRVYEMVMHYSDNTSLAKAFLRVASICEQGHCNSVVDRVKQMKELTDDMQSDIMALEIKMGKYEEAKKTFFSIKNPETKYKSALLVGFFIEKENWNYFDMFFKELHDFFKQESQPVYGPRIFSELIKQITKKDVDRALNLVRKYWSGYGLASCFIIIVKELKNQKADFLPLAFETRSLITSLLTSNEDAGQALNLLKELLELHYQ